MADYQLKENLEQIKRKWAEKAKLQNQVNRLQAQIHSLDLDINELLTEYKAANEFQIDSGVEVYTGKEIKKA